MHQILGAAGGPRLGLAFQHPSTPLLFLSLGRPARAGAGLVLASFRRPTQ